jgi:chemotaxis protein methyltransferase CheR
MVAAMSAPAPSDDALFDLEIELFLEALYRVHRHDFRHYVRPTLRRRLSQALSAFSCSSVSMLQHRLLREPSLVGPVIDFLTVQVSDLFRDPPFYAALRTRVLPLLRTYPSIRVWIAGCGAGEEVYSLAIMLDEEGLLSRSTLYATDVNRSALREAELGVYRLERAQAFSRNYQRAGGQRSLSDYYMAGYDRVAFARRLRENTVFSDHSLATDNVFAEVHLVTCRNVLIYFDTELRDRAVGLFRESLVRRGFLGLGAKENLRTSVHAPAFAELDRPNRLYEKAA